MVVQVDQTFMALGARVVRLDSGDVPLHKARHIELHPSGGEYNVACNLHDAFGIRSGLISAAVENHPWGTLVRESTPHGMILCEKAFRHNGVDGPNIASVFSDRGYGPRGPKVVYNRANEAAALLKPEDFDFDQIFEEHKVGWAHTGGIFSALSKSSAKVVLAFVKKAREKGIITSFDLNYRNLLWELQGGTKAAQRVLRQIVEYVDVLVGNEEDLQLSLGLKGPVVGKKNDMDSRVFRDLVTQVNKRYPEVRAVATTLRHVRSRNRHDWGAALWLKSGCWDTTDGSGYSTTDEYFEAPQMDLDVLDRIGGGDGFATALFYCLIKRQVPDWAQDETTGDAWTFGDYCVRMGTAHGALLTSTKGDTTGVKRADVEHLARGGSARVVR